MVLMEMEASHDRIQRNGPAQTRLNLAILGGGRRLRYAEILSDICLTDSNAVRSLPISEVTL